MLTRISRFCRLFFKFRLVSSSFHTFETNPPTSTHRHRRCAVRHSHLSDQSTTALRRDIPPTPLERRQTQPQTQTQSLSVQTRPPTHSRGQHATHTTRRTAPRTHTHSCSTRQCYSRRRRSTLQRVVAALSACQLFSATTHSTLHHTVSPSFMQRRRRRARRAYAHSRLLCLCVSSLVASSARSIRSNSLHSPADSLQTDYSRAQTRTLSCIPPASDTLDC
jgi:hypothetical protein